MTLRRNPPSAKRTVIAVGIVVISLALALHPRPAIATQDASAICDRVAQEAARQTGIPIAVLQAISLTETGRKRGGAFRPWPWTVNMEGKGVWFETEQEALAYAYKEYRRGARSFDIGCFQINYKWHGQAFRSIEDMFDPLANALYAARFLKSLYLEQGDWGRTAGAYHSRTREYAERYQARFEKILAGVAPTRASAIPEIPDIVLAANRGQASPATPRSIVRVNLYPLLQAGAAHTPGSLVPANLSARGGLVPSIARVATD